MCSAQGDMGCTDRAAPRRRVVCPTAVAILYERHRPPEKDGAAAPDTASAGRRARDRRRPAYVHGLREGAPADEATHRRRVPKRNGGEREKDADEEDSPGPPRLRPSGSRTVSERPPGADERHDGGHARGPAQGGGRHWLDAPSPRLPCWKKDAATIAAAPPASHAHHRQRGGTPCLPKGCEEKS